MTPDEKKLYHREYNRKWAQANPERVKANVAITRTNKRLEGLIRCTRQTASKKGLDHTITVNDLVKVSHCPLTGIEIDWSVHTGRHSRNPSIDRIDPDQGYIPGNVEVMSSLGNTMKCNATPEQLVAFAKEILKRYDSNK